MPVVAVKNGKKKTFSDYAWKLLGKNKNGWEEISDLAGQPVVNEVVKTKPVVNPAIQEVSNEVENTVSENVVSNEVGNKSEETATKESFIENAKAAMETEAVKRNQLKDFLDGLEVSYKQNISNNDLLGLVADNMNNDIELFKSTFNIA